MKTSIYYFSGTGNSLFVAEDLSRALGGELISIASVIDSAEIAVQADAVGIVFPVYFSEVPVIVKRFAQKLEARGKYVFAVATFGGAAGMAYKMLAKSLAENGGRLSAGFGIHMPQNTFRKPWENHEKINAKWKKITPRIVRKIECERLGLFHRNAMLEFVLRRVHNAWLYPAVIKTLAKITGADASISSDEMIRMLGKSFEVSDTCNGCGICVSVCPAGNIEMKNSKPFWGERCETCLACYNWCPKAAISSGIMTTKDFRYKHPHITLSKMQKQKPE